MGDSADSTAKPVIGVDLVAVRDLAASLESATDAGLEFICAPLFHPRFRRDTAGVSERRGGPGTRSDVVLECARWTACVVGKLSPWIDVDATESSARTASEAAFKEEVSWASHLHVPAIAVNLRRGGCANLALHISQAISPTGSTVFFWVRVPVLWPATADGGSDAAQSSLSLPSATPASRAESDAPWLAWNELRSLVEGHAQVGVALELCDRVPTAAALERWAADRVKAVFVPTRLFVFNRAGYPTLPAHLQAAVHALWRFRVQVRAGGAQHVSCLAHPLALPLPDSPAVPVLPCPPLCPSLPAAVRRHWPLRRPGGQLQALRGLPLALRRAGARAGRLWRNLGFPPLVIPSPSSPAGSTRARPDGLRPVL